MSTLGKGGGERIHLSLSGFDIRFLHSLGFDSPPQILGFKHFQTGSYILLAHSCVILSIVGLIVTGMYDTFCIQTVLLENYMLLKYFNEFL